MISETTKAAINEATSVSPKEEVEIPYSDIKIIYGPLLKYGAVALVLVSFIITSAIIIEQQAYNTDNQVVMIDQNTELLTDPVSMPAIVDHQIIITVASNTTVNTDEAIEKQPTVETTELIIADINKIDIDEVKTKEETIDSEIISASAVEHSPPALAPEKVRFISPVRNLSASTMIMAQHRDIMLKQDQIQIERITYNHEKYIETLREQSDQQNIFLEQNIKQLEANHLKQIAAIKRGQDLRKSMTNRI